MAYTTNVSNCIGSLKGLLSSGTSGIMKKSGKSGFSYSRIGKLPTVQISTGQAKTAKEGLFSLSPLRKLYKLPLMKTGLPGNRLVIAQKEVKK